MRAFASFIDRIFDRERKLKAEFDLAAAHREALGRQLADARAREDSRSVGYFNAAYKAATNEALRAELAYRAARGRQPSRVAKRSVSVAGSAR